MKRLLTICLFSVFFTIAGSAQSDYDQIAETVSYYLDGGTNNDFETLKKAFHPDATMKYIKEGYQEVNAVEFFQSFMKPGPPQNRETKIISIDVSGEAAHAKLEIQYPTFAFIDYMNLLKIDGEWKIVNKIFHKRNDQ